MPLEKGINRDAVFGPNNHVVHLFSCKPTQALALNLCFCGAAFQRQAVHIKGEGATEVSKRQSVAAVPTTDTHVTEISELDLMPRYSELLLHLTQGGLLRLLTGIDFPTEQAPVRWMDRRIESSLAE